MKSSRIAFLALLFAALSSVLPAFAQDIVPQATASADMQTYKTGNGLVTIQFPANWVSKNGNDSDSILAVEVANSQAALDKDLFGQTDVFNSGEVHVSVAVISLEKLVSTLPAGTLTTDSSPLEILQALIKQGMPDTFTFGSPGEMTLNGRPAVRMNLSAEKRGEGQILFTIYDKYWLAGVLVFAAPGEGDKWDIVARDILYSIQIADQGGTTSTTSYTSEKGHFTIAYPANMEFIDESDGQPDGFVGGLFYTTQADKNKSIKDDFKPGELHIELAVLTPANVSSLFGKSTILKLDDSTSAAKFLREALKESTVSGVHYGAVQEIPITTGALAQADVSGPGNNEGHVYFIKRETDGTFMFIMIYAAPHELEKGEAAALSIAASLSLNAVRPISESTSDPLALTKTTKTQNGLASVSYPAGWYSRQLGQQSIYVSNSQTSLEKSFGAKLEAGEVNLLLSVSSTEEYIKEANLPLAVDASPLELLQATTKLVGNTIKFGTLEPTTVSDKVAARVDFIGDGFEGTAWLIEYQKGTTIAVQMLAAPGDSQHWGSIVLSIAQSIQLTDQ